MSENATAEQIASTIGLEAVPENVRSLTSLVSRQEAPMADIAKLICKDKELTARLLRAANPRAASEEEYNVTTVDAALMRAGVGCALLLAMSHPLIRAVKRTFETMIGVQLRDCAPGVLVPLEKEHLIGTVSFEGKATGCVNLRFSPGSAAEVASAVLGFATDEEADVNDVIGELGNMVVGNFKSNLCDAGLSCKLNPPKISRTNDFKLRASDGGLAERTGFRGAEIEIFVDILVNPWSD